jgi:hypothetical protein
MTPTEYWLVMAPILRGRAHSAHVAQHGPHVPEMTVAALADLRRMRDRDRARNG